MNSTLTQGGAAYRFPAVFSQAVSREGGRTRMIWAPVRGLSQNPVRGTKTSRAFETCEVFSSDSMQKRASRPRRALSRWETAARGARG